MCTAKFLSPIKILATLQFSKKNIFFKKNVLRKNIAQKHPYFASEIREKVIIL